MKKILALLMIMAIAMGSVFAVEAGQWGGDMITGDSAASLEVTMKLSGKDIFNIGFASEAVTAETINSEAFKPLESLELELDGTEYQGTAYVYYGIKAPSNTTYTISLAIDDNLRTTVSDKTTIPWKISSVENFSIASNSTKTGNIFAEAKSGKDGKFNVDFKKLNISTEGFMGLDNLDYVNPYSANVTVTIKANGV